MKIDPEKVIDTADPELLKRVGASGYALPALDLDLENRQIEIFDQALTLGSDLRLTARILDDDKPLQDPFGSGAEAPPPADRSFAVFDLAANLKLGGEASTESKGIAFSAHGTAGGAFTYRHLTTVSQGRQRNTVMSDLLGGVRLPQFVPLDQLAPGEVHQMTAKINLDLGLEVSAGASTPGELAQALFEGLSPQAKIQGSATAKAALGFSLFDEMRLTVGRGMKDDSWPRLRLERSRQDRLSLSATLQLMVEYDLASPLESVLDNALDQVPTPRLLETLREVDELAAGVQWQEFVAKLGERGAEVLDEFLERQTHWRQWVDGSPEVEAFVRRAQKIVDTFGSLDPRIEGLWQELLGKVDLEEGSPIRQALGEVAAIDPQKPDVLAKLAQGNALGKALDLIEKLTGRTVDEMILDSLPEAQRALAKAVFLANQALDFLRNTPQQVIDEVDGFARRAGIQQTVSFLAQNATSKQAISNFVSTRIKRLVEVLVGKAWQKIDAQDLAKVQAWAQKMERVLEAPEALEKTLRDAIAKLEGQASFDVGMAIDRESSRTALIDFELDAGKHPKLAAEIQAKLEHGRMLDIRNALSLLDAQLAQHDDEATGDDAPPAPPPFRLRESLFTSRLVRTRAFSLAFKGFGISLSRKGISRRIEESRLRIHQLPPAKEGDPPTFERRAGYCAGYLRRDESDAGMNETALWLESEARGEGMLPDAPYDGTPRPTLRLVYCRQDGKATAEELRAIATFLARLGFAENGAVARAAQPGWTTQLTVELRFVDPDDAPGAALDALIADPADEEGWNRDVLAAAHAWLGGRMDDRRAPSGLSQGRVLGAMIEDPPFLDSWTGGVFPLLQKVRGRTLEISAGGKSERVDWTTAEGKPNMRLGVIYGSLVPKRRRGLAAMARVAEARQALAGAHDGDHYRRLSRFFVDAGLRSAVYGKQWTSSLFILWLTLTRIARRRPDLLPATRGLVLLRTRADADDPWQPPVRIELEDGVKAP